MYSSRLKHNLVIVSLVIPILAILVSLPSVERSIEIIKNAGVWNTASVANAIAATSSQKTKCVVLTHTIEYQSTDSKTNREVSTLQQFLFERGYLKTKPDGVFGFSSVAALKKYQYQAKIADLGYLDTRTQKRITSDTCSTADLQAIAKTQNKDSKVATSTVQKKEAIKPKSTTGTSSLSLKTSSAFKVLSPKGGESILPGSVYSIQWTGSSSNIRDGVRIALAYTLNSEQSSVTEDYFATSTDLDLSNTYPAARALASEVSGIPEIVTNKGRYIWKVPSTIPAGSGYRLYLVDIKKGIYALSTTDFTIVSIVPEITKTRLTKIKNGYIVSLTGKDFKPGWSVRFSKEGKTLTEVPQERIQVFSTTQIQFNMQAEDIINLPTGNVYKVSLFETTTDRESKKADMAFW